MTSETATLSAASTAATIGTGTTAASAGTISLVGFKPTGFEGSKINFNVTPANQNTVRPLRNFILDIDTSLSTARAVLDFQNTQVTL